MADDAELGAGEIGAPYLSVKIYFEVQEFNLLNHAANLTDRPLPDLIKLYALAMAEPLRNVPKEEGPREEEGSLFASQDG